MKEQKFSLNLENKDFNFEIDRDGYVWIVENNSRFKIPEKTNIGQLRPIGSLDEAKEIAKIMLYASHRVNKLEQ